MLRARAEDGLWHIHHGQGDGAAMTERLYGRWRAELVRYRDLRAVPYVNTVTYGPRR
ncbi:hypothetical protein [Streptomyces sp. NPDC050485]|uniref:hypothetical protein n=1 Tax=Streptomyces sp. NPDC050485 TaxID=3365617 RepID=UPI0037B1C002